MSIETQNVVTRFIYDTEQAKAEVDQLATKVVNSSTLVAQLADKGNKELGRQGQLIKSQATNYDQLITKQKALKAELEKGVKMKLPTAQLKPLQNALDITERKIKSITSFKKPIEFGKSMAHLRKEAKDSAADFSILGVSVGGTIAKIKEAVSINTKFFKSLTGSARITRTQARGVVTLNNALGGSRKIWTNVAKSVNIFRIALLSTGIGAIIVGLGSLVTFLTKTQKGMDFLSRATAGIGGAFNVVIEVAGNFGSKLIESFSNPVQSIKDLGSAIVDNVINRFKSALVFGDAISELFKGNFSEAANKAKTALVQLGTGLDEDQQTKYGAAISETTKQMKIQADQAALLAGEIQSIRDAQIQLDVQTAKSRSLIKQLNKDVEDTTRTYSDRITAAQEVNKIEENLLKRRVALQAREVEAIRKQNQLANSTIEDKRKLAEAEIELANIVTESNELQTTNQNKLNTLIQQQETAIDNVRSAYLELQNFLAEPVLSDPLTNLRNETFKALDELDAKKEELIKEAIAAELPEEEINKISQVYAELGEKVKADFRKKAEEINAIPLLESQSEIFKNFIESGEGFEKLLPQNQFDALFGRFNQLNLKIAEIGDIESVDELNLKKGFEDELNGIIELLQDSPLKDEIEKLIGNFRKSIITKQADKKTPFLQELLGLNDEQFAEFDSATNDALAQTQTFLNSILDAQEASLDERISLQESRVERAASASEKGNAKQLQLEEERLNKLNEQREKAAKKKQAIAAIEIAASQAVAVADGIKAISNAIAQPFPANLIAVPLTIGLLANVGIAASSLNSAFSDVPSFFVGTEDTGPGGQGPNGERIAKIHKHERIVPEMINKELDGVKNKDLPRLVQLGIEAERVSDNGVIQQAPMPKEEMMKLLQPYSMFTGVSQIHMPREMYHQTIDKTNTVNKILVKENQILANKMDSIIKLNTKILDASYEEKATFNITPKGISIAARNIEDKNKDKKTRVKKKNK